MMHLADETAARSFIEARRWPLGIVCPDCSSTHVRRLGGTTTPGLFLCNSCRERFSCRTGTFMAKSHVPLHKWLAAVELVKAEGERATSQQIMGQIGLGSWRSAASMRARILAAISGEERAFVDALCSASAAPDRTQPDEQRVRRVPRPARDLPLASGSRKPETRALSRAIDILEALGPRPLSLAELHRALPLSHTTLRRLVHTLVTRKLVRIGLSDGKYRLNIAILSTSAPALVNKSARLIGAAEEEMRRLTALINLPVDLHIFDSDRMVRVESTHPDPLPNDVQVEVPLNVFAAASGLAYLSTLADSDIRSIIDRLAGSPEWGLARFGLTPAALISELRDIRRQGFAVRRVSQVSPDRFRAIAIPLMHESAFAGSLAIWWPSELLPISLVRRKFLPFLKATGSAIEGRLARS